MGKAKTVVQQHTQNFDTLKRAFAQGHVALMECKVVATGEVVATITAVTRQGTEYCFTPFAIMMNGNPYELLAPPDPDRPGKFMGESD